MAYNVERHSTDVLIVGGGIAGALAAIQAREDGAEVILLERANTHRSGAAGSGVDHLFSYVPPVHERVAIRRTT
ncbi:MAG: FAD-dependent oxidoreductase [Clostridia bacterium]